MVMVPQAQAGILAPVPPAGRYVWFDLAPAATAAQLRDGLRRLADWAAPVDSKALVIGIGATCVRALGAEVPGLHDLAAISQPGIEVPATPAALCCWLRGRDRGDLLHLSRQLAQAVAPAFEVRRVLDGFRHGRGPNGHGRDLTGYEDGTENPTGREARTAALVRGEGEGLDGASFLALQVWTHDLDAFDAMPAQAQDGMIGRRRSDNEELDDAPASAHVKRTAQESFSPEAFVLRRSMPWAEDGQSGLVFVAFGRSLDAFEAQLRRMTGLEDGITDALFQMTRPVTSASFWCPPLQAGRLDLRRLGL